MAWAAMQCVPWFLALPPAGAVHPGLSEKFTQTELLRVRIRTQICPGFPSPAASGCHQVEKGPQRGGLGPRKTSSLPPLAPQVASLRLPRGQRGEGGLSLRFSFFKHVTTLVRFMELMTRTSSRARAQPVIGAAGPQLSPPSLSSLTVPPSPRPPVMLPPPCPPCDSLCLGGGRLLVGCGTRVAWGCRKSASDCFLSPFHLGRRSCLESELEC